MPHRDRVVIMRTILSATAPATRSTVGRRQRHLLRGGAAVVATTSSRAVTRSVVEAPVRARHGNEPSRRPSSKPWASSTLSSSMKLAASSGERPQHQLQQSRTLSTTSSHASNNIDDSFATSTRTTTSITTTNKNAARAVPLALYRQLLKWCHSPTRLGVPLSSLVPPVVHLRAPEQLDAARWHRLAQAVVELSTRHQSPSVDVLDDEDEPLDPALRVALRLLIKDSSQSEGPPKGPAPGSDSRCWGIVDPQSWTAPVHDATDLSRFFRVVFRANRSNIDASSSNNYQKQRVSAGFEALRSLSEIDSMMDALRERRALRQSDMLNHTLCFQVGQVVQHKEERWRGVVVGWEKSDEADQASSTNNNKKKKATSLTFKDYGAPSAAQQPPPSPRSQIRYYVVLDDGEAHLMGVPSPGQTFANEDELSPVHDPDLLRIRSRTVSEHFVAFDRVRGTYVPNELLRFEYALDALDSDQGEARRIPSTRLSEAEAELCQDVIQDCVHFASSLNRIITDELLSNSQHEPSQLLTNLKDRLDRIQEGDVVPMGVRFATRHGPSLSTVAAHHVRAWHNLQYEVMEIAFSRQAALEHRHRIQFRLGDVVRHKVFGYRGIVVGWDPKPTVDVSRWDGLEHIEEPAQHPFYHVVPDRGDSVEAFGGERPVRYVCQENLEVCSADGRFLDVDLEPQEWTWNSAESRYAPSDALRFKYAEEDVSDDTHHATERCVAQVQDAINRWQYEARIATKSDSRSPLSMHKLIQLLQIVDNTPDAIAIQEAIKEMRKSHPRLDLWRRLEDGLGELMQGNGDEAIAVYASIADQEPDSYPEVHNKLATCLFMMGRIDEALEATLKTLALDPFHVQAQNGLGLIYFDKGEYKQAIEAFRKSIRIDPWSPVTAKLSVSIDLVNQNAAQEEGEGATDALN